jgi:hypothetical protein
MDARTQLCESTGQWEGTLEQAEGRRLPGRHPPDPIYFMGKGSLLAHACVGLPDTHKNYYTTAQSCTYLQGYVVVDGEHQVLAHQLVHHVLTGGGGVQRVGWGNALLHHLG